MEMKASGWVGGGGGCTVRSQNCGRDKAHEEDSSSRRSSSSPSLGPSPVLLFLRGDKTMETALSHYLMITKGKREVDVEVRGDSCCSYSTTGYQGVT